MTSGVQGMDAGTDNLPLGAGNTVSKGVAKTKTTGLGLGKWFHR